MPHAQPALPLRILVLLALLLAPASYAADDTWDALLKNQTPEAATRFAAEAAATGADPAAQSLTLEGLYQAQILQGDDIKAFATLIEALKLHQNSAAGVFHLNRLFDCALSTGRTAEMIATCRSLLEGEAKISPAMLPALNELLYIHTARTQDKERTAFFLSKTCHIKRYARIIGPFTFAQNLPLPDQAIPLLPPQSTPDAEKFDDFNSFPVKTLTNVETGADTELNLRDLLPSPMQNRVYFLQVALRSPTEQTVVLTDCEESNAIWLNGWPVYQPELFSPTDADSDRIHLPKNIRIKLKQGVNTILFRTTRSSVEARVRGIHGQYPDGITFDTYNSADWAGAACRDLSGFLLSTPAEPAYLSELRQGGDHPAQRLQLAGALEAAGRWDEAEETWQRLREKYPESALIAAGFGHFLRREAHQTNYSSDRLHKQAGDLFQSACKSMPDCIPAVIGLALLNVGGDDGANQEDYDTPAASKSARGRAHARIGKPAKQAQSIAQGEGTRARRVLGRNDELTIPAGIYAQSNVRTPQEEYLQMLTKAVQKHPDSLIGRQILINSYLNKKWNELAREEIAQYQQRNPADAALAGDFRAALGEIAAAQTLGDAAWAAGQTSPYTRFDQLTDAGRLAPAREVLEKIRLMYPNDHTYYYNQLERLEGLAGNPAGALAAVSALAQLHPLDPEIADRLGINLLATGDKTKAAEAFKRSVDYGMRFGALNPGVLDRLADCRGEKPFIFGLYEGLEKSGIPAVEKKDYPRANYATLLRSKAVRIYDSLASQSMEHNALKVFDKEGISELAEMPTPRNGRLFRCHTIQPDGKIFVPDSTENLNLGKAMSMYNVRPGSVLDYGYASSGSSSSDFEDELFFEDFNSPVLESVYTLMLPKTLLEQADITVYPEDFAPEITEEDEFVTLNWTAEDLAGKIPEPLMPAGDRVRCNVKISIPASRPGGNRDLAYFPAQPRAPLRPALRAKAAEITKDAKTGAEKTARIFDWIAAEIGDRSGGEPNTPYDTLLTRTGSQREKLELCSALLSACGIRSWKVRTNHGYNAAGYIDFSSRMNAIDDFGDLLLRVCLPDAEEDEWLTFHDRQKFYRRHDINPNNTGTFCLEESPSGWRLDEVRPAALEGNIQREPDLLTIQPNGSARLRYTRTFYGSAAAEIRASLENPHEAKQFLAEFINNEYPRLTDLKIEAPKGDALTDRTRPVQPLTLGYQGTIRNFCSTNAGKLVCPAFANAPDTPPVTPLPRENDIELGFDCADESLVTLEAPAGWTFCDLPRNEYILCDFGRYLQQFKIEGGRLHILRSILIPAQRIAAEDAPAYNRFIERLNKLSEANVSLQPLPTGYDLSTITAIASEGKVQLPDYRPYRVITRPDSIKDFLGIPDEKNDEDQPAEK